MKQGRNSRVALLIQGVLAGLVLAIWCPQLLAQAAGGAAGGAGGTAAPGGGATGGGMAATGTVFGGAPTTGGGKGGTGAVASPIQKSNFLATYYANPLAAGLASNVTLSSQNSLSFDTAGAKATTLVTGRGAFGVPMYANTATATSSKGGGGMGGGATSNAGMGFSTMGVKRVPQYVTKVDSEMIVRPVQSTQTVASLKSVLAGSSTLRTAKNLNVWIDDSQVVVLQGTVETERDRKLAEGLVRTDPYVRFVRNEIVVTGKNN